MTFEARLGGGLDGCVWKVRFGDQGPFALKVFWDTEPPAFAHYYAPQRECQNAALLQMMETAVKQAVASCRPILVNANPTTWEDALANLAAFSDEARHQPPPAQGGLDDLRPGLRQILAMPCIRKCYGWLTLKSKIFGRLPRKLMAPVLTVDKVTRFIAADKEYMAIVYEYVEGENDPAAVQESLDFFWLAGFSGTLSQLAQNWKSGVLVDLSDIAPPRGYGWSGRLYQTGPGSALAMLKEGVLIRNPAQTGTRGCPHPALRALPSLQRSGAQASSPQLSHSHSQECDNATENSSTTAEHPEKPPGETSMELLTPRASHPIQNGQPVSTEPKADRTPSRTCKRKGIDGDEEVGKERRLGPPRAQQLPVPT